VSPRLAAKLAKIARSCYLSVAQSPRQGGHGNFFRNTFDVPCVITTSYDAVKLCPAQGSREATPRSDRETPSDIAAHVTQEGIKGRKKRRKQCLQGTMTTIDCHDGEVGAFGVRRTPTATRNDKHWVRLPMDHFKSLLEEACPKHAYLIRHKLKDYDMMRSCMTAVSITWGVELDEGPDGSDMMSFPEENTIMMVYTLPSVGGGTACLA
jgi:hypothetical protein